MRLSRAQRSFLVAVGARGRRNSAATVRVHGHLAGHQNNVRKCSCCEMLVLLRTGMFILRGEAACGPGPACCCLQGVLAMALICRGGRFPPLPHLHLLRMLTQAEWPP